MNFTSCHKFICHYVDFDCCDYGIFSHNKLSFFFISNHRVNQSDDVNCCVFMLGYSLLQSSGSSLFPVKGNKPLLLSRLHLSSSFSSFSSCPCSCSSSLSRSLRCPALLLRACEGTTAAG